MILGWMELHKHAPKEDDQDFPAAAPKKNCFSMSVALNSCIWYPMALWCTGSFISVTFRPKGLSGKRRPESSAGRETKTDPFLMPWGGQGKHP